MNIIFLVSSFLLIFVFLNATILKNSSCFHSEKKNFCDYLITKQNLESKLEQHKYHCYKEKASRALAPKKKQNKILPKDDQPNIQGVSHRFNKNPHTLAKCNLGPLILNEKPSPHLQKSIVLLLKDLYGHTDFWKEAEKRNPHLDKDLLSSFKEKRETLQCLSDLFPGETELQPLFYKMLKGSGSYCVSKKTGYPPLEDFFSLSLKNDKTVELPYACYPVLRAFLGEELTSAILEIEKEKSTKKGAGYRSILAEEFQALLTTLGPETSLQDINSMISSTNQRVTTEKLICNGLQGVSLKMPLVKISPGNGEHKKKK